MTRQCILRGCLSIMEIRSVRPAACAVLTSTDRSIGGAVSRVARAGRGRLVRVSRRGLLLLVGGLSLSRLSLGSDVALADVTPPANAAPAVGRSGQPSAGPRTEQIGRSRGGQPLTIVQVGTGRQHVLILGGQHGGPEANTVVLVDALLDA